MDVGSSFSYVFEDEDWVRKILIGAAVGLIPIVGGLLQMGFALDAMKRTINHTPIPLPEWDEWGDKLVKGLIYWVILFVYLLPFILIASCLGGGGIALASGLEDDTAATAIFLVVLCVGCLSLVLLIATMLLAPAAIARYADTGEFGAAFQFGEVLSMVRENINTYVIVLVMTLIAVLVGGLGSILCGVGLWVTAFYAQLIIAYLYGSAYNVAMGSTAVGEAGL